METFGHTSHTVCFMGMFPSLMCYTLWNTDMLSIDLTSQNLLHFHWLDIFSPFSNLAIKASFTDVLVKLKLPLYHF